MKVLVTGAAGRLAGSVIEAFGETHAVTPLSRGELDITNHAAVRAAVGRLTPDVIINCAAYNDVDGAQRDPRLALEVNALGVLGLARAAAAAGAMFVHYSTDFVFDGEILRAHLESDPPRPMSFYGATKLLGERFCEDVQRHYILRVESLFGGTPAHGGAGSLGGIVRKLRAAEEVAVFTDRVVSPSYAPDVARATRRLVESGAPHGVYHCVNSGAATWEEIAREAAAQLGVTPRLTPITMASLALPAPRPRYCALDTSKIAAAGAPMRPWQDALHEWLQSPSAP
jgi:dTDP-4-dehydrorhamnose reductase